MKSSTDVIGAIEAVAEIYEMSDSKSEQSHIESGGSLEYRISVDE